MSNLLKFDASKIKLAQVRYFDVERNGCEIPPTKAYVILLEDNGTYMNVFSLEDHVPVYSRVPYSNTTRDGEDFGTKIVLSSGEVQEGMCYVLDSLSSDSLFGDKKTVSYESLKNYVLNSDLFFPDRISLLRKEKRNLRTKFRIAKQYKSDLERFDALSEYFLNQEKEMQYRKKN